MGLFEIIRPSVSRYREEARLLPDVVADLAFRTAEQHLDIAWSRMATDATHDVAVFLADGQNWCSREKDFYPARTASRISQATSWLIQLRLIDPDEGVTTPGKDILERCLATMRRWERDESP
jgi:hypothetical protein